MFSLTPFLTVLPCRLPAVSSPELTRSFSGQRRETWAKFYPFLNWDRFHAFPQFLNLNYEKQKVEWAVEASGPELAGGGFGAQRGLGVRLRLRYF
jgi:hypothetical protein